VRVKGEGEKEERRHESQGRKKKKEKKRKKKPPGEEMANFPGDEKPPNSRTGKRETGTAMCRGELCR